ncbi:hypothetical protein CMO96_02355 [Candidatus Woesebacteria bacterium]|nr:hypothetical protein [Candidatus Woesebacteria bacterium]
MRTLLKRYHGNPILTPNESVQWEAKATFNPSIVKDSDFHMLYRAISNKVRYYGKELELSTICYARSADGYRFYDRRQFVTPENEWEQFGCEDPRVTKIGDTYYIFYTALSDYPHTASGIRSALAITRDFKTVDKKYLITPFNAKAMVLFPEKINGKYAVMLSVNTDNPPSDIAICYFDKLGDISNQDLWKKWYEERDKYKLELSRRKEDHVEVGAVPFKTKKGWLMVYSYIRNYFAPPAKFEIKTALLDIDDPTKIIANNETALLAPVEEYELHGMINNIVFPTSTYVDGDTLKVYYGAADTVTCVAEALLSDLLGDFDKKFGKPELKLMRYDKNPIITPNKENAWEAQSTFNPTAVVLNEKVHILYRALSEDNTSTIGYATSKDGYRIDEKFDKPIYSPREKFEMKAKPNAYSGCEDARLTLFEEENKLYMCYTAYSGVGRTGIALTSISVDDFKDQKWNWEKPFIVTDTKRNDKNGCIFPEKIRGKYALFHRIGGCVWLDLVDDLNFENKYLGGKMILCPEKHGWDSRKVGIAGPPIKTEKGWLLIFHALSLKDDMYRLGAMLLDAEHPDKIISKLEYPLIQPEKDYEIAGLRRSTIFSCGAVVKGGDLIIYYGGADKVIGVASIKMKKLLDQL